MVKNKIAKCPCCGYKESERILDIACGSLGKSVFSGSVKIEACIKCGHIYNYLSSSEKNGLSKYYNKESAALNLSSIDKFSDRPGNNSPFALQRYSQLYNLISPYIQKNFSILDVGCATGGFLDYLYRKGFNNLYGIDTVKEYVNFTKKKNDSYKIKVGNAESIPFNNKTFDLLVADQIIEHLANPLQFFKEAKRVLNKGGILCVGVPDALRYNQVYFFDFYWFLIKEHIQHFDIKHLKLMAASEGFELIVCDPADAPIMSAEMILPNMNIVFRLTGKVGQPNIDEDCFKLKKEIKKYIADNNKKLKAKRRIINKLIVSQKPLYIWGIGRECMYLYESAGLKKCNIIGLIDSNPYKHSFLLNGKKITNKSILQKAESNSVVVITAVAHKNAIKHTLKKIGFKGEILEF